MNRTRTFAPICRLAGVVAALVSALLAATAAGPAAFANHIPPSGGGGTPSPAPTVIIGGMPGWQIALIAAAAAVAAVILDRARDARRGRPVRG
jgi:hypothetical protein